MSNLFWIFLVILVVQRLSELWLARRNEEYSLSKGAVEYDKSGYKVIVLMHVGFFISLVSEYLLLDRELNPLWIVLLIIFIGTQVLRYWAIKSLGYFWNTKILVIPNAVIVNDGPYKYLKHPNYVAVVTEIAVIPLLFSCYITAVIFTILNILVLKRRIRIEEQALSNMRSDH